MPSDRLTAVLKSLKVSQRKEIATLGERCRVSLLNDYEIEMDL